MFRGCWEKMYPPPYCLSLNISDVLLQLLQKMSEVVDPTLLFILHLLRDDFYTLLSPSLSQHTFPCKDAQSYYTELTLSRMTPELTASRTLTTDRIVLMLFLIKRKYFNSTARKDFFSMCTKQ